MERGGENGWSGNIRNPALCFYHVKRNEDTLSTMSLRTHTRTATPTISTPPQTRSLSVILSVEAPLATRRSVTKDIGAKTMEQYNNDLVAKHKDLETRTYSLEDAYAILGMSTGQKKDKSSVQGAHRAMKVAYHPDKWASVEGATDEEQTAANLKATKISQEVDVAYEHIKNERRRTPRGQPKAPFNHPAGGGGTTEREKNEQERRERKKHDEEIEELARSMAAHWRSERLQKKRAIREEKMEREREKERERGRREEEVFQEFELKNKEVRLYYEKHGITPPEPEDYRPEAIRREREWEAVEREREEAEGQKRREEEEAVERKLEEVDEAEEALWWAERAEGLRAENRKG